MNVRDAIAAAAMLCTIVATSGAIARQQSNGAPKKPWVVAHRGASAYAPENTVPAFELAAQQGATFVEFDLQLTKDKQVVCLHDNSLERTTDVEQVFPDRARTTSAGTRTWMLEDFTLAEVKRLDAGAWFDAKFRGTRIPTFGETIDALRGKSRPVHRGEVAGAVRRHRAADHGRPVQQRSSTSRGPTHARPS